MGDCLSRAELRRCRQLTSQPRCHGAGTEGVQALLTGFAQGGWLDYAIAKQEGN